MPYRYRIVLKDGREYYVSSDLTSSSMVTQEKRGGILKEMYVSKGVPEEGAVEKWEKVFPASHTY
jgi:type II restriction/modification system DNA methylase subunit YeeA